MGNMQQKLIMLTTNSLKPLRAYLLQRAMGQERVLCQLQVLIARIKFLLIPTLSPYQHRLELWVLFIHPYRLDKEV